MKIIIIFKLISWKEHIYIQLINAMIISISTRSIQKLYDIKATLAKLKAKKYIYH